MPAFAPRSLWASASFFVFVSVSGASRADPPAPSLSRAAALYDAAKDLMDASSYAAACPKLAESLALDSQVGTMLNLAYCYENIGRTASAWSMWLQAAAAAAEKGETEREEFARYRAQQLEPHLLRVTIAVAPQRASEWMELTIDLAPFARSQWGMPTPLDPGEYELRASAAGERPWSWRFTVDAQHVPSILVPVLEPLPLVARPADSTPERRPPDLMPVAWAAGGLGVAALGVSAAFGVSALLHESASYDRGNCVSNACNAAGKSDRFDAIHDAQISSASFAVGGGALLTAAVTWIVSSRAPPRQVHPNLAPAVAEGRWSLSVDGVW
jgi:hypothetical protein